MYLSGRILARCNTQVGKIPLGTAAYPETNATGLRCSLGLRQHECLLPIDRHADARVSDVERERDPFVVGNVAPGFVAPVRILPAEPVEFPVRIGKVLDRPFVARRGGIGLAAIKWTQIDRLEAHPALDAAVGKADEG